jgi:hypothetical protein
MSTPDKHDPPTVAEILADRIRSLHVRMLYHDSTATVDDARKVICAQVAAEDRADAKKTRELAKGRFRIAPIHQGE